jgi:hypothetical protein
MHLQRSGSDNLPKINAVYAPYKNFEFYIDAGRLQSSSCS